MGKDMRQRKIVPIVIISVFVVVLVAGGIYLTTNPALVQQLLVQMELAQPETGGLAASGFIEADEVAISSELGGRVVDLLVGEGDEVNAGQVLLQIDETMLAARIEAAQAALDVAQARLRQVRAGARPEQLRQAEAALAQAEAARDGAHQAWQDAVAMRDNPQDLDAQIAQAEAQVAVSDASVAQASALHDVAEIAYDGFEDTQEELDKIPKAMRPGMQLDFHLIPNAYRKAQVGVNIASAAREGARTALDDLRAVRDHPQELDARINQAEAQYHTAEAAVDIAQAGVDVVRAGATEEQIAVVEAQVEQAQAALDALLVLRGKQTIIAPIGGLILEMGIHVGELAVPGASLLTLGDLDQVTLTIYVPEDNLGQVVIGQSVAVRVDAFPERNFIGTVVAIAHEAEFTPRNVQTKKERVNMVFAVDVRIANPDHALKPGLPADAVITTQEQ